MAKILCILLYFVFVFNKLIVNCSLLKLMPLPEKIDLIENMTYYLVCNQISGSPEKTKFEWTQDDAKLFSSNFVSIENSLLTFKKVQKFHAGRYQCKASINNKHFDFTQTLINVKGN